MPLPDFYAAPRGEGRDAGKVIVDGLSYSVLQIREFIAILSRVTGEAERAGTTIVPHTVRPVFTQGLTITNQGGTWEGTMSDMVEAFIKDVTTEGPIEMSLTCFDDPIWMLVNGVVTDFSNNAVLFEDGEVIDVATIDTINIY